MTRHIAMQWSYSAMYLTPEIGSISHSQAKISHKPLLQPRRIIGSTMMWLLWVCMLSIHKLFLLNLLSAYMHRKHMAHSHFWETWEIPLRHSASWEEAFFFKEYAVAEYTEPKADALDLQIIHIFVLVILSKTIQTCGRTENLRGDSGRITCSPAKDAPLFKSLVSCTVAVATASALWTRAPLVPTFHSDQISVFVTCQHAAMP